METLVLEKNEISKLQKELLDRRAKTDVVVRATNLKMTGSGNLTVPTPSGFSIDARLNNWSKNQLASYVEIPAIYYNKLAGSHVDLLAHNVNYWLERKPHSDKRLIRTYQGEAIAVLSDRYRAIDNYDVATIALETANKVLETQGRTMQVLRSYITDRVMNLTIMELEPSIVYPDGEQYRVGLEVRNSEVGAASFSMKGMIVRQSCTNGHIWGDPISQRHIGKRMGLGDIWSQRTIELQAATTLSQADDMVKATFDLKAAQAFADALQGLKVEKIPITAEYQDATEKILNLSNEDRKAIWGKVESNNKFELVQAITAHANDLFKQKEAPEKATDMQELGGKLVNHRSIWDEIAKEAEREGKKKQ